MKKTILLLVVILCVCVGCRHSDPVVAEVYNKKLFASEVASMIPSGLSAKDSIDLANQIIDDWITDQVLLQEAEKTLSVKEKIFDKELEAYRKTLLKNKYFEKITADADQFKVSDDEVRAAIQQTKVSLVAEKEIVRLNYVKLPKSSPQLSELRDILFNEERRLSEKEHIAELCADSIEYFINDDQWLFWDDIQLETKIELGNAQQYDFPSTYETSDGTDSYIVVILDFKSKQTGEESDDYFESVRTMLIQQKKNDFIQKKTKELYQKANKKGKINR